MHFELSAANPTNNNSSISIHIFVILLKTYTFYHNVFNDSLLRVSMSVRGV